MFDFSDVYIFTQKLDRDIKLFCVWGWLNALSEGYKGNYCSYFPLHVILLHYVQISHDSYIMSTRVEWFKPDTSRVGVVQVFCH